MLLHCGDWDCGFWKCMPNYIIQVSKYLELFSHITYEFQIPDDCVSNHYGNMGCAEFNGGL